MQKQYKGGLHIHTTVSDGRKTPDETARAYKNAGYDFIAMTDHWKFNPTGKFDGMTVLSGIEYDVGRDIKEGIFHIVGIGASDKPDLTRDDLNRFDSSVEGAQFIIDRINEAGGAAILAHPAWSVNRTTDIMKLHGLSGIEMYNAVSGLPFGNRANSDSVLDMLAADGYMLPVHAADDTHFWSGEECSSFVLTTESDYVKAVKTGKLYASRGPRMEITRDGNKLHIECTPAKAIVIQTGMVWIDDRVKYGENVTSRDYTIRPTDIFARVEVVDAEGNTAWSGYYV